MKTATSTPIKSFRIPVRHRIRRHLLRLPALLVWCGTLVGVIFLHQRQEHGFTLTGVASEVRYLVASAEAGRLDRLEVALGQEVVRDQVVACLDGRELLLDLREARAEVLRLGAEVERESEILAREDGEREVERLGLLRRYARDVDTAVLDHLTALADQAEDRIRLQGLALGLGRIETLKGTGCVTPYQLDADRAAHGALEKAIAERERRLPVLAAQRQEAERRYDAYAKTAEKPPPGTEAILLPHRHSMAVQELRIERVSLQITNLVLRAPGDGRVAEIRRRSGEYVAAGEPVVAIVDSRTTEVVAWLPEHRISEVRAGERVRIRQTTAPNATCESTVAFLGAGLEPLPERIAPRALVRRWGLSINIPLPASLVAMPGEALQVDLLGPREAEPDHEPLLEVIK